MAKCEKILIAGFSGAGKSTLLEELKQEAPAGWSLFEDLDQLILRRRGGGYSRLADLIDDVGWETFRLWERQELESWLKEEERGVLALGGGTLSPVLLDVYGRHPKVRLVHLAVSFETCWQRLLGDEGEPRPLVRLGQERLLTVYEERLSLFKSLPIQLDGERSISLIRREFWSYFD